MGWDCTFHLVDPARIESTIAALVAGEPAPASLLASYPERGAELWAEAGRRVLADAVSDACQIACQIAIYAASAEFPDHDERGVALSFGFDPSPRRLGCWVPESCMASPESMFPALLARRPELARSLCHCARRGRHARASRRARRARRWHLRQLGRRPKSPGHDCPRRRSR